MGHPPGSRAGVDAGLTAISNLLATLIARGQLDEAGELAEQWDLSAPFSVGAAAPRPARDPGHPSPGSRRAGERSRGPARGRRGPGGDGILNPAAIPWRQEVVPALGALDRTAEARRIVAEGEKRARAFGAAHVIGAMLRARSSVEPKRRAIQTLRESIATLEAERAAA